MKDCIPICLIPLKNKKNATAMPKKQLSINQRSPHGLHQKAKPLLMARYRQLQNWDNVKLFKRENQLPELFTKQLTKKQI